MLAVLCWFAPGLAQAQAQAGTAQQPAAGQAAEFQNLAEATTVDRGITCLDSGELVEHVSSWLGTDRVWAPLTIEVHGSPHFARTVWFRITRGGATLAERHFEPAPERCDDLHAAVGLAIALALKASLLDSLLGAGDGGPRVSRPYRVEAQALGGFAVVVGANFGIGLGLSRAIADRFAVRLSTLGLVGPNGDFQQDQGRFKTWLAVGRLDLCSRLLDASRVDISLCVGIAAGGLYATGEAFPMSRNALIPYVAVANAVEVDVKLTPSWSLNIAIDVLVTLRRTGFVVRDEAGAVLAKHDLAAVGGLLAVGPAYHF